MNWGKYSDLCSRTGDIPLPPATSPLRRCLRYGELEVVNRVLKSVRREMLEEKKGDQIRRGRGGLTSSVGLPRKLYRHWKKRRKKKKSRVGVGRVRSHELSVVRLSPVGRRGKKKGGRKGKDGRSSLLKEKDDELDSVIDGFCRESCFKKKKNDCEENKLKELLKISSPYGKDKVRRRTKCVQRRKSNDSLIKECFKVVERKNFRRVASLSLQLEIGKVKNNIRVINNKIASDWKKRIREPVIMQTLSGHGRSDSKISFRETFRSGSTE